MAANTGRFLLACFPGISYIIGKFRLIDTSQTVDASPPGLSFEYNVDQCRLFRGGQACRYVTADLGITSSREPMRILNAFRAFFGTLFYRETAQAIDDLLSGKPRLTVTQTVASELPPPEAPKREPAKKSTQSAAITLLAMLQREARLVDFLMEDLTPYTDEQVGAAVREIHRDTAKVLERIFALQPVVDFPDGASLTLEPGFQATQYRLTGRVAGEPPFTGVIRHAGWKTTRCAVAEYTGDAAGAAIIAPAEVEVG